MVFPVSSFISFCLFLNNTLKLVTPVLLDTNTFRIIVSEELTQKVFSLVIFFVLNLLFLIMSPHQLPWKPTVSMVHFFLDVERDGSQVLEHSPACKAGKRLT